MIPKPKSMLQCLHIQCDYSWPSEYPRPPLKLSCYIYIIVVHTAIYRLMTASLCTLVGNAEAERLFSVQNRIKTSLRNRLSIAQLDRLIRVSYENIPPEEFDFDSAQKLFFKANRRL